MKAITYQGLGDIRITDAPEPGKLRPNDALVRLEMTGICGTDHKIIMGKLDVAVPGTIIGHEGVGTVVDVGEEVSSIEAGDRVIINPTQSCLTCRACRLGNYCYCENFDDYQVGFSLPGTFTEYISSPARWLYKIPEGMSWELASLIEPLGCSLNTLLKSRVQPHESVLVIGSGPIGIMCQTIASSLGSLVVSSEPSEYRREFSSRVASIALAPEELTAAKIRSLTGDRGFDVVIDAVGNQLASALTLVNKGGRVIPMGYDDTYELALRPTALIDDGVSVIAEVPQHDAIGPAIALAQKHPALEQLITTVVEFDDFETAFEKTMGINLKTQERTSVTAMKGVIRS